MRASLSGAGAPFPPVAPYTLGFRTISDFCDTLHVGWVWVSSAR
jgi:hypothetical protein